MINKILEFNENSSKEINFFIKELDYILKYKNEYPKLYKLLTFTSSFCNEYFNILPQNIIREKRYLKFETPNRINIEHEYTITKSEKLSDTEYYYLFTPVGRLDWLEIKIDSINITIANNKIVKDKIFDIVSNEYQSLIQESLFIEYDEEKFKDFIYNNLKNKPCFIEYISKSTSKNFILNLNYFASFKTEKETISVLKKIFTFPFAIIDKKIEYTYTPLNKKNSAWLYLKAPKQFEISNENKDKNIEFPITSDPEVSSLVINSSDKDSYNFKIKVKIPGSLKTWFNTLYGLSMFYILFLITYLLDNFNFFTKYNKTFAITNDLICKLDLTLIINLFMMLCAAIIATRSWLIFEETLLKRLSNRFSLIITISSILVIFIYLTEKKQITNFLNFVGKIKKLLFSFIV